MFGLKKVANAPLILEGGLVGFEQITNQRLRELSHLFNCNICLQVVNDPIECPKCSSVFCRTCIEMYQTTSKNKCVMRCTLSTLTPANRTLRKLLSEIEFTCNN
jgi:hypothetical protein